MVWRFMAGNETTAYAAGIVDGEGSIVITVRKPNKKSRLKSRSHQLGVVVANTRKELPEWLKMSFGGFVWPQRSNRKRGWRVNWTWNIYANKAKEFLKLVLPFLILKKRQAELAIEFQEIRSNYGPRSKSKPEEQLRLYDWYKSEISKLGRNGDWMCEE